jgi:translation initiation factor 4A
MEKTEAKEEIEKTPAQELTEEE